MKSEKATFHKKVISFVKYNKLFLSIYRVLGNCLISFLKLFIKVDRKKILFMSFGGQKYDDSPKALYEAIREDPFFEGYELVWCFADSSRYNEVKCKKVNVDSIRFYKEALSSAIWVNNSSMSRGLNLKRKGIFEINTWHGTPLKKMGNDIEKKKGYSFFDNNKHDILYCSQSEYDQEIFSRLFGVGKEKILISDLPRNDALQCYSNAEIEAVKRKLGIDQTKKVVLYAPTFREYERNSSNSCYINPPINLEKWREKLGDEYTILFRAHYEIVHVLGIHDSDFLKNVSDYPYLADLMVVSDILISDYSSIYFDYSILEKPMFNFSYDYEVYCEKRGLYLDLEGVLPCKLNRTEDELLNELLTYDRLEYCGKTKKFKQRFCPNAGNAVSIVLGAIKKHIGE